MNFWRNIFFPMCHGTLFLIIETFGLLRFWEENLDFKFFFIHILCIMHLNVRKLS